MTLVKGSSRRRSPGAPWGSTSAGTLRVNYRTSHQIRRQADRLLPPETSDVDGNTDRRTGTVSVFNGAESVIHILPSHDAETAAIAEWLKSRGQEGYAPHEMGVFVRSKAELDRAIAAVGMAGYAAVDLAQHAGGVTGNVAVGTMHLAKGLEFRAVVVAACDAEALPSQAESSESAIKPNSTRSTPPSATCSTSRAPMPAIISW